MKEYIITIATAAVIAAIADILAPQQWSKYIRITIGFLIMSVVIAPIANFRHAEILSPKDSYEVGEEQLLGRVAEELCESVEKDIEERLRTEFSLDAKATVWIDTDGENRIKGVRAIEIRTWKNPDGMTERLKEIYGCDKVELKFE